MGTALNISWSEVDNLFWSEFVMLLEKLEDIRTNESSKMSQVGKG